MKPGRNDSCPCGSGKKYKKCCLNKDIDKTGTEDSLRERLINEMLEFAEKKCGHSVYDAYSFFWDEFNPEEHLDDKVALQMVNINFWDWFIYDWVMEDGQKVIDHFITQNQHLKEEERGLLNRMRESTISLYEIQEVFPEKGFIAKDLLLGGDFEIKEKLGTRTLVRWDVLAIRLLPLDGSYVITGSVYPYSQRRKNEIIKGIMDHFDDYKIDYPDVPLRDFLKEESWIFNFLWYDAFLNPPQFKLHTTTGEPLLFSKAVFDIKDRTALLERLKTAQNIEEDKECEFIWYAEQDEMRTLLGRILIKDATLTLETNSKARLERGVNLIVTIANDSVTHKINAFESPDQAMKRYQKLAPKKLTNEIPKELEQTVYTAYMQKHYERWLFDKIPALGNETPVETSRTKKGREQVKQLLKEIENAEERNKNTGKPYYDISWLWERLNMER